jgi:hypothetical protein
MRAADTFRPVTLASLLALAGAAGCDEPSPAREPVELRPGGGFGCSWCGVQGNGPIVNGADLPDLDLGPDGTGTTGFKLRGGQTPGLVPFLLAVDPATERFYGYAPGDPDQVLVADAGIVGSKIVLEAPNTGQIIYLEITDYDAKVEPWTAGEPLMTAYRASYFGTQGQPMSLCPSTNPENQWFTLIAGETYDRDTHEVEAAPTSVSLACVGEAAAKMKLLGFGPQGQRQASVDERTATLRMITADYCGDGTSFTVSGEQVAWRDRESLVTPPFAEKRLEAKWGPHGALCLEKPRHADLADVLDRCAIPACEDDDIGDGVIWRTMLPE